MTSFEENGYVIVDAGLDAHNLYALFERSYLRKFTDNTLRNRNLIKMFTNDICVRSLFSSRGLLDFLNAHQTHPVATGPIVSHYTSMNETGSGYALPFHQDWPSMATSSKSLICWVPLTKVGLDTHSIEIVPGSHRGGALPGRQLETGYVVDVDGTERTEILEVNPGEVLFMSAWLVHRTHINMSCSSDVFKLALSLRFDDLEDADWNARDFVTAYGNTVDRELWLQ